MTEAWKIFLEGRIAQEEGNNAKALEAFNFSLSADPDNIHFLRAKAVAEAADASGAETTRIASEYSALASSLTNDKDKPSDWVEGLKVILAEAEKVKIEGASPTLSVVW